MIRPSRRRRGRRGHGPAGLPDAVALGDMCGIIGATGSEPVLPVLLEGLARLEYRGSVPPQVSSVGSEEPGTPREATRFGAVGLWADGQPRISRKQSLQ